ncbi:MAG TPA: response regulator [Terriglobales bacterium]|nr:response regulator [Terriglobales bacterium]
MSPTASAALPLLVIEDEPTVMPFLSAALERYGYRMVPAASGVEGLKLLAAGDYLGVISDMRTPGGVSGADVHAWIVAHRPQLVSRVLFITGDTVNEETSAILRQTGAPCVEKPFRVQQLMAVVQKIFGKAP